MKSRLCGCFFIIVVVIIIIIIIQFDNLPD